ncbi:hypothetical protein DUNSADRAFT_4815 [Dunaliella salina]|uniref:Uncharacterized protein n=1 Tax=Dunaliella salina TaxID=3046 RepID=A0ABQ7GRA1_DUNSA|nr:hypothetical protein DUNSADRAFT_4815 [Dunaliella salina]|eukprot:KAF5837138.1 hypothetical protein DUNSADRAFT_4815 [Dunaliella salina]
MSAHAIESILPAATGVAHRVTQCDTSLLHECMSEAFMLHVSRKKESLRQAVRREHQAVLRKAHVLGQMSTQVERERQRELLLPLHESCSGTEPYHYQGDVSPFLLTYYAFRSKIDCQR